MAIFKTAIEEKECWAIRARTWFIFFYFIYSKNSLYIYLFLQEERTYCLASSSASSSSSKCATCPLRKWTRYYGWVSCIKITLATVKKSELKGYYLFYGILLSFSFLSLLLLFSKAQLQSRQLSPYPLSKYRDKQELAVADINQHTNDFATHKTRKKKKNRITADAVLLQLILRDSFSIK